MAAPGGQADDLERSGARSTTSSAWVPIEPGRAQDEEPLHGASFGRGQFGLDKVRGGAGHLGRDGPSSFLHGVLVDGSLWDDVVALLPDRACVVLELPLGSHTRAGARSRAPDARGRRRLDPRRARAARALRTSRWSATTPAACSPSWSSRARPERIARLVLTPCDALEVFPPALFKPMFALGGSRCCCVRSCSRCGSARAAAADRVRVADQARRRRAARALGAPVPAGRRDPARRRGFARHVDPAVRWTSRRSCGRSRARS